MSNTFDLQQYLGALYARFPEADHKPVIGITGNYDDLTCKLGQGYYKSVVAACPTRCRHRYHHQHSVAYRWPDP